MPDYIVRVELQGESTAKDYAALDEHMLVKGFGRTIAEDGVETELPALMYSGTSLMRPDALAMNIHNSVRMATWPKLHIFVIERRNWYMFWTN